MARGASPFRSGATRSAAARQANEGAVLRLLRDRGPSSRAQIGTGIGLPKATVAALVTDLLARGLLREAEVADYQGIGRPRQALELDARHVCGLGVEIGTTGLRALAMDVHGSVVYRSEHCFDVVGAGADVTLDELGALLREARAEIAATGVHLLGVHVAVPGTVDSERGVAVFAVNLGWREVPVAAMLRERLGYDLPGLRVVNDVMAAARAELVDAGPGTDNLLLLTGDTGVGGGIVLDRRPAWMETEIGHAALGAPDVLCACGRRGCWEATVGLAALLARAADEGDPVRDAGRDVGERLAEVGRRARAGEARTSAALDFVGGYLAQGLSILNDVLGPQAIILGGYFGALGEFFVPRVQAVLDARKLGSAGKGRVVVRGSGLGFAGVTVGAVQLGLEVLFEAPGSVPGPVPGRQPDIVRH